MAIDQVDIPRPVDDLSRQRPHLLFHLSGFGEDAVEPMIKFGLLAKSPTLTPRLDIATHYASGDILTFWYPMNGEVTHLLTEDTSTPTRVVTNEMKQTILEDIEHLNMDQWTKTAYTKIIEGARTYLPGKRLRAVAKIPLTQPSRLELLFPEDSDKFISLYTQNGPELREKVKAEIENMNIDFLDPTLTREILADDIVRTYVEHNLLTIGKYPGDNRQILEKNLQVLGNGSFEDPVYERYRTMLVARLQKRLQGIHESQ